MMEMKELAEQLRKPHGENSKLVTDLMAISNRPLYEFTYKKLDLFPEANILEVGPADGHFVHDLFKIENSVSYTGVDLSEDMIKAADQINSDLVKNEKARFTKGDILELPFDENSFDRIFTINTLYFWSDPEKGIRVLNRILKPSGKLFIVIRSKESMEKMPFTQYGFTMYSKDELNQLLTENGFSAVTVSLIAETAELPSGGKADMISFCAIAEKK